MKDIFRIIFALLLTPAYMLADESVKNEDENDNPVVEELKENDEEYAEVE